MYHQIRWTAQKIAQRLALIEPLQYRQMSELQPFRYRELDTPRDAFDAGHLTPDADWVRIDPGTYWGHWYTNFILHTRFEIPADFRADALALFLPLGEAGDFSHPEALLHVDGVSYAACDRHHQEVRLDPAWQDGREHDLTLVGWTGLGDMERGLSTQLYMRSCFVVEIDPPTRELVASARVALGIANSLPEDDPVHWKLINALDEAFKCLDTREPFGDDFYRTVPAAHAVLKQGIAGAGAPIDADVYAAGHAHIDVAWLWTLDQTRMKARRTFQNVIRNMEHYPHYHFTQSQAQLYDYLRHDDPQLFAEIQQRVREGRWEVIGGTWVEMDCNLSGGESLARQFLLGRSFFNRYFDGQVSPVLWLPDVFGYAWNLPQLIREAGFKYFFTIKIGWNQYNRLPFDSFWWQGLDGSRVITHFSPTPDDGPFVSTYNAAVTPGQVLGTWNNFRQKDLNGAGESVPLLMAYGYGDGGGGPTREMIENAAAMQNFPATPRVHSGKAGDFFQRLEQDLGDRLPTWNGELYLELHRGTYTTQSRNKRANRKSEFALHDAEFAASLASVFVPGYQYPQVDLTRAWELVCLNQFHDIIPGSSVTPVYVESLEQYQTVANMASDVLSGALDALASGFANEDALPALLLVNPTGFARRDLAVWQGDLPLGKTLAGADGQPLPLQQSPEGILLDAGEKAAHSITPLFLVDGASQIRTSDLRVATNLLENAYLRVELNEAGDIVRITDKRAGREVLPPGGVANQFQAFEDRPNSWDAWDIDIHYDDRMWLSDPAESIRVVEVGPLRGSLEIKRRILGSEYVQRISLEHNSSRLDFDTTIEWVERHILLKVAFPVDVLAPAATYEIQWGNVQRPTHRNTSWDWARFETCAQKWVDLSEGGYGVSLLNDCKYGHDIQDKTPNGGVMRISLLRGTTMPDPIADMGEHRFAYSLLPHQGGWDEQTVAQAYAFNDAWIVHQPSQVGADGVQLPQGALIDVDQPNMVIETVKRAEDGSGLVVRLYESQRKRTCFNLRTAFPLKSASLVNLMEEEKAKLVVTGGSVSIEAKPYQIVTVKLIAK